MKRAQLISKGSVARLLQAADEARRRQDFQGCIDALERASRMDPGNPNLLLNLGHARGSNYDYAGAEEAFERVFRLSPKKAEALAAAGFRARDFGNQAMAERYYRMAAEQKDVTPESLVALAEIAERYSRLEEAAQWIDRALALQPNIPAALLVRARLARQAGQLDEAKRILQSFPTAAERDLRARAHYERGGILDREGRYDEAMAAFLEAKALLAPNAAPHIASAKQVRTQLKALRENLNPEILKRWHESRQQLKPLHRLALLCGHPRSGTTLLEQVLDSHPDIVSAEETRIFHDNTYPLVQRQASLEANVLAVLEGARVEALQGARGNYFRCMEAFLGGLNRQDACSTMEAFRGGLSRQDACATSRLLVDKNPILTFLLPLFVRIFPEAKLLIALRDPRDVCLSCFMQPLGLNQSAAAYLTLEGTVEDYAALMSTYQVLAPQMQNERLEVRYEDMVNDLESVSRRVLEFLGVTWNERVLHFHEHARQKLVRSPTYADVTKPVFKRAVGRWEHYRKYLEPYLPKLEPFVKAFGYEP